MIAAFLCISVMFLHPKVVTSCDHTQLMSPFFCMAILWLDDFVAVAVSGALHLLQDLWWSRWRWQNAMRRRLLETRSMRLGTVKRCGFCWGGCWEILKSGFVFFFVTKSCSNELDDLGVDPSQKRSLHGTLWVCIFRCVAQLQWLHLRSETSPFGVCATVQYKTKKSWNENIKIWVNYYTSLIWIVWPQGMIPRIHSPSSMVFTKANCQQPR